MKTLWFFIGENISYFITLSCPWFEFILLSYASLLMLVILSFTIIY